MRIALPPILLGLATILALFAARYGEDLLFRTHAWVLVICLALGTLFLLRRPEIAGAGGGTVRQDNAVADSEGYMDGVVRYGLIATLFWGIIGFIVGILAAAQLAWPELNLEPWFNFGRIRPLHTSAVAFAFDGNALLMCSFYLVQRTTRATLRGGDLAWCVFWVYPLLRVVAAPGYPLAIT